MPKFDHLQYYIQTKDDILIPENEAYSLKIRFGIVGFLQKFATWFLRKTHALTATTFKYQIDYNVHTVSIDINKLIDSLVDYMNYIELRYDTRPAKILIGFDVWDKIAKSSSKDPSYVISFHLNQHRSIQRGYDNIDFRGVPMQYTPWINGIVFVPEDPR